MQTFKGRWCPLIVKLTVFGSVQPLILKLALEQTWLLCSCVLFSFFCPPLFFHVAMLASVADVVLQTVKPLFQLKHFNFDSIS